MKRKLFVFGGSLLFALFTIINVNMERRNNSFMTTILSNIEAYASSSEGEMGGRKCGRAAYTWTVVDESVSPERIEHFVQCVKGCPDKRGIDPLFQNC